MTIELKPFPFCGEELHFGEFGFEHPYSDTCPLDSLYIEDRHVTTWNARADAALRRERVPVEPVAWLVRWKDGGIAYLTDTTGVELRSDQTLVPLYTTPPDALTAIERAAYERGVRDAQNAMPQAALPLGGDK